MHERVAGAPIAWGGCEFPGWGPMPPGPHVLCQCVAGQRVPGPHVLCRCVAGQRVPGPHVQRNRLPGQHVQRHRLPGPHVQRNRLPGQRVQRHRDARIAEAIGALDRHGYDRSVVLEQDTAITGEEPTVGSGLMLDVKESIAFLMNSARTTQEVS